MPLLFWGVGSLLVAGLWAAKGLLSEWNEATVEPTETISTVKLIAIVAIVAGGIILLKELKD